MPKWGRPASCSCGTCDRCRRAAYMREWYRSKTFEERRAMRAGRDLELARERDRKRHEQRRDDPRYQQQRRAVTAVNNAIRDGRLTRQPCEVRGGEAQAHHDDYTKPLEVRWLCTKHHAQEHNPDLRDAA